MAIVLMRNTRLVYDLRLRQWSSRNRIRKNIFGTSKIYIFSAYQQGIDMLKRDYPNYILCIDTVFLF